MAISHINGIIATSISHVNTIAKANISAIHGITASFGGGGYDADAQAYFTAYSITDETFKNAWNTFVVSAKADGYWSKFQAVYPFPGGSAAQNAGNAKNPGTFDITWNGTVTHNSNGVTGNGSTGYGDTGYNINTHGSQNDLHISFYCRTSTASNTTEIGCAAGTPSSLMQIKTTSNQSVVALNSELSNSIAETNGLGMFIASRTISTGLRLQIRTTNNDITRTSHSKTNANIYILARNVAGTASSFSSKNCAFASIGTGLTSTEAGNFSTAVETFQDALSRGVV